MLEMKLNLRQSCLCHWGGLREMGFYRWSQSSCSETNSFRRISRGKGAEIRFVTVNLKQFVEKVL